VGKSLFRRYPTGRLTGYSLVKHTRKDGVHILAAQFFEATTATTQTLAPPLLTNSQAFFSPTVSQPGGATQTLTPGLHSNSQTFFAAALNVGPATLAPGLLTNAQAFYFPTVANAAGGAQTLTAGLYSNSQSFYGLSVTAGAVTLAPALVAHSNQFYSATLTPGAITLAPIRLESASGFFAPAVTAGPVGILPGLLTNAQQFFAPSVAIAGAYVLTAPQAAMLYGIYLLHGLRAGSPLTVSQTQRIAGGLDQAIAEAGGTVTITTNSAPGAAIGDIGMMVEELAALHGLTVALNVTSVSRSAGSVTQNLQSVSGAITVTRQ
jgi:hypothetical protein